MLDPDVRFIDRPFLVIRTRADGTEEIVGHYKRYSVALAEAENVPTSFIANSDYVLNQPNRTATWDEALKRLSKPTS